MSLSDLVTEKSYVVVNAPEHTDDSLSDVPMGALTVGASALPTLGQAREAGISTDENKFTDLPIYLIT